MFRNILVPLDFSDKGRTVTSRIGDIVASEGGVVHLLHVIETIDHLSSEETREFYEMLDAKAWMKLQETAEGLEVGTLKIMRHVTYGKTAPMIVEFARENDCDLVLLASHVVQPGEGRVRIGTVSHQVALMAPCPVLLLR